MVVTDLILAFFVAATGVGFVVPLVAEGFGVAVSTLGTEMKRWLVQALVAVVLAFLGVVVLRVAMNWGMFGASPYVQYMKWVHNDVPRFTIPVQLVEGTPVAFQARILQKHGYELNLLVYFSGKKQRAIVEDLIGGAIAQPINAAKPPRKLPTTVSVTVQDQDRRVVHNQIRRSDGRIERSLNFLGRELALLPPLDEGLYTISVTALSDVSGFAPFRTDLELTYLLK
jgi:hypothetical protein